MCAIELGEAICFKQVATVCNNYCRLVQLHVQMFQFVSVVRLVVTFIFVSSSSSMGGWSRSGLDMDDITSDSSEVTCLSSHLTSFAILVDASGVTGVSCHGHSYAMPLCMPSSCVFWYCTSHGTGLFDTHCAAKLYIHTTVFIRLTREEKRLL